MNLLDLAGGRASGPFNEVVMAGAGHRVRLTLTTSPGPWHHHPNTPETFIVLQGVLRLEFRDGTRMDLGPGTAYSVPAGVSHRSLSARAVSVSVEVQDQQVVLEDG